MTKLSLSLVSASIAKDVIVSARKEIEGIVKLETATDTAITKLADHFTIICKVSKAEFAKGTAVKNPAKAEVKAIFEEAFPKSAKDYQTAFWFCWLNGFEFKRSAFKKGTQAKMLEDAGKQVPETKSKADAQKAGKIESTDRKALDATLSKAIKQARLLSLTGFAADILDLCLESLDGFKEAE